MNPAQEKRNTILFLAIFTLAIALRAWWFQTVPTQPVTDFDWYFERARDLASSLGYQVNGNPTAYWPVGYPLFLAAIFKLLPATVTIAKLANTALTLLIVYQTYVLARRLHQNPLLAHLTALITAIAPPLIAYSTILASEPLYTALTLAATLAVLRPLKTTASHEDPFNPTLIIARPREQLKITHFAAAGFWIGLATLVRPQAAILPFLLLAGILLTLPKDHRPNFKPLPSLAICLLILTIVITPWTIRNYKKFNTFVFISTNGGDNLWIGHNPNTTGRYLTPPGKPDTPKNELKNDKQTRQQAISHLKQNPSTLITSIPKKLEPTFLQSTDVPYWAFQTEKANLIVPGADPEIKPLYKRIKSLSATSNTLLLILPALGILLSLLTPQTKRILPFPLLNLALVAFLTAIFFGNPRFAFPLLPYQAILAATIPIPIIALLSKPKTPPSPDEDEDVQPSSQEEPDLNISAKENH